MARRGPVAVVGVDTAGAGKQGYCKLCSFEDGVIQTAFDDRVRTGWSPAQLNRWLERKIPDWPGADRNTVYRHRTHVQHPQDRLVTAVRRTEQRALQERPQSSPEAFLDAVVTIGHQRAIESPEEVTIDHALRAASARMQAKDRSTDALRELVALITGHAARPVVVEGTATEVADQ